MRLLLILALSLLTRFAALHQPKEVVFDEVHWGKFISHYCCSHTNFFDVHPPHGKLLVAGLARLTGYQGDQDFSRIGLPYKSAEPLALRGLSAFLGALIPVIAYLVFLALGVPAAGAFLGAFVLIFDNALLLQSRIMGLYPMLLLTLLSSLLCYLSQLRSEGKRRLAWEIGCGLSCGFAMGLQFTGILALAVVGVGECLRCFSKKSSWKNSALFLTRVTALSLVVYLIGWYVHFSLLPLQGPGDAFYPNSGYFWTDLWKLHGHMYRASATLTTAHPEASNWWTWPFMKVPIYYWKGNNASLYFVGNPVFWWGVSALFFHCLLEWAWMICKKKDKGNFFLWLPFSGYIIGFLPLTLMKRVLFLYHYLTPLTYSLLFVMAFASYRKWGIATGKSKKTLAVIYVGIIIGFLWLSPLTFGFSMPDFYWKTLPWRIWH
jgi:dolichyl-phosphate-mannose-protein mannosyltransferase